MHKGPADMETLFLRNWIETEATKIFRHFRYRGLYS